MHPEEIEFREENRFLASVAERVLRADPLLLPYFEDGILKMTDCPEDEFLWFAPEISRSARRFIQGRVREVLSQKPPAGDEAAQWLWEEREKVRRELETDSELFPAILAGDLQIQNSPEGFKIEIDPEVPDDEAATLNERLAYVLAFHFGITPRPE